MPNEATHNADADFREAAWIVVPAFREGAVIGQTVLDLKKVFRHVVVVDDCSPDDTSSVARDGGAIVCRHPINLGQGAAIQTGLELAVSRGAQYVVTFDADGQHRVEDVVNMLGLLREKSCDIVLGSRFLGSTEGMSGKKKWLLKLAILYTRLTSGLKVTDTHNGLRVMTAQAASRLDIRQNRMAHASEILNQIASQKMNYIEAPCKIIYTDYSVKKGQRMTGAFAILHDLMLSKLYR